MDRKITMFYGKECPHCHVMLPLADQIMKEEEGILIQKLEVWHNDENADKMREHQEIIIEACDGELGVPAFIDEETNKAFCGEKSYNDLKEWMTKK